MKAIKILFAMIIAFISTQSVNAQSNRIEENIGTETQSLKVSGECGMCKKRIEKAALTVEGIKWAEWNEDRQILIIQYDVFKKKAIDNAQKSIAAAGHDTDKYRADDAVYQALPGCCKYQRKN